MNCPYCDIEMNYVRYVGTQDEYKKKYACPRCRLEIED